jgi:hypothetical protein
MSKQLKPIFITGSAAKVVVRDQNTNKDLVLGYCMDINCRLDTPNVSLDVLGMYEPIAIVPTASSVFGGFSVIRYLQNDNDMGLNMNENGNSFHNISMGRQIEPGKLLELPYFSLVLYKREGAGEQDMVEASIIKDCRIINKLYTLNKRSYVVDRYQFMGRLSADTNENITESAYTAEESNHAKWTD